LSDDLEVLVDLDEEDEENASRAQQHRLQSSRANWRNRAQAAEREVETVRAQIQQLESQHAGTDQLKTTLLQTAIRTQAATLVSSSTAIDDILRLVDVKDVRVGDDGTIDVAKVKAKVEKLIAAKRFPAGVPVSRRPRSLPGGHRPIPQATTTHGEFNDLVRAAAGGRAF
jgi:hypothetical protein